MSSQTASTAPQWRQHALAKNAPKMHAPIDTVVGRRVMSLSSCKSAAAIKIRYASRFRAARAARSAASGTERPASAASFIVWRRRHLAGLARHGFGGNLGVARFSAGPRAG